MTRGKSKLTAEQQADADRLKAIFTARAKVSQAIFAAENDLTSQVLVWQYLSGHRPLNLRAAKKFATGLGVAVADFSPSLAKEIEQLADLPADDPEVTRFIEPLRKLTPENRDYLWKTLVMLRSTQFTGNPENRSKAQQKLVAATELKKNGTPAKN